MLAAGSMHSALWEPGSLAELPFRASGAERDWRPAPPPLPTCARGAPPSTWRGRPVLAVGLGGRLCGEPPSDVSWPLGPGSWPGRAGNAPNTLLPAPAGGGRPLGEAIL